MKLPAKIGPWKREDFESFLALPDHAEAAPRSKFALNALMTPVDPVDPVLLDERLKAIHVHPIFIQLNEQENFKALLATFKSAVDAAKPTARAARPDAILGFLNRVVLCMGGALASERGSAERGYGPTSENRTSARSHIAALQRLADKGAFLEIPFELRPKQLLQSLDDSLRSIRRKKRAKGTPRLEWVSNFARLIDSLGVDTSKLILEFSALVGVFIDPKTARRYRDEIKAEKKEESAKRLAAALK